MYTKAKNILSSQGKFYTNLGLERITKALAVFENPQKNLQFIHVAGTNGKGSTCCMLASIFKEAGYKTGLYTSPHLVEYTERIQINGAEISQNDFSKLIFEIVEKTTKAKIHLTEFEILTVLAFLYFKKEKTDIVILETGLGGRLDATNVITPILSVITSINFDHIDRLGDTIEKITTEKAGIIKPQIPCVISKNNHGVKVVRKKAKEKNSELFFTNTLELKKNNTYFDGKNIYKLCILGLWQKENLELVIKSIEVLQKNFNIKISHVQKGLINTKMNSRFQYIEEKNVVIDGAHNVVASQLLKKSLNFYFPKKQKIFLYASLTTKDFKNITKELFEKNDTVILTKSSSIASVEPKTLKEHCSLFVKNENIYCFEDYKEGLNKLLSLNNKNSILVIAGSLYLAGDVLALLNTNSTIILAT